MIMDKPTDEELKLFLGKWKMSANGKMKKIIDPLEMKWIKAVIELAENRGYQNCLKDLMNNYKK